MKELVRGAVEQRIFDPINDGLPDGYKLKLVDRSYHEGASRDADVRSADISDPRREHAVSGDR
jgi:hypothetical protein